jgi:hypothetical protein
MPNGYDGWQIANALLVLAFVVCIVIAGIDEWRSAR